MDIFQNLLALTLFGSVIWGIIFFLGFIVICFIADVNENGFFATVFLLIFGGIFYFFGRESYNFFASLITWKFILFYFGLGLIHAITRIFFYGRKQKKIFNERRLNPIYTTDYTIERDIKNHVFRWWFLWPVSLPDLNILR